MKVLEFAGALALVLGTAAGATAQGWSEQTLVVTASNTPYNNLLVYNSSNQLLQTLATGGKGGVSGNSGGIANGDGRLAVVNFGSQNVSIFELGGRGFRLGQIVRTSAAPVSVAFGHDHLYVLETTKVESFQVFEFGVSPNPDGAAGLVVADGSAAQVGVLKDQVIISEKSNAIETVNLRWDGSVNGAAALVANIPANVNAPFGLVTRDNEAYVTIAHANEISLVRNDSVVTITGSGTQNAPCWLALEEPYLFSSNSPSMSISRYVVYGPNIIQDAAVAATLNGNPTDIAYGAGLVAVIDSNGTVSHLSIFSVDWDGNLALQGVSTMPSANGVVVVHNGE